MNVVLLKPNEVSITEKGIPILVLNNIDYIGEEIFYIGLYSDYTFRVSQDINCFNIDINQNKDIFKIMLENIKEQYEDILVHFPFLHYIKHSFPRRVVFKMLISILLLTMFSETENTIKDGSLYKLPLFRLVISETDNPECLKENRKIIYQFSDALYDYIHMEEEL